jgi:hypothetical protein
MLLAQGFLHGMKNPTSAYFGVGTNQGLRPRGRALSALKEHYEPDVVEGADAAGVLLVLSLEAGLPSFEPPPDSDLEVDSELESELDELLSDDPLFEA